MASHRYIWGAALALAAIAIALMSWRTVQTGSHDRRVSVMLALLDEDPQARRDATRESVEAVIKGAAEDERATAEMYYALGLKAHGRKSYEEAAHLFEAAIALRPDWALAHNNLAITRYSDGYVDEAEESFYRAIAIDPRWSRPYNDLAVLYRRTGNLEAAAEMAEMALRLDPHSVDVLNNYGNLLVRLGEYEEASKYYEEAMLKDPSHAWPHYNLACLYAIRGEPDIAIDHLTEAIRLHPEFKVEARVDDDLKSLHGHPRFQALMQPES